MPTEIVNCFQVKTHLKTAFSQEQQLQHSASPSRVITPVRRSGVTRVFEAARAISLCHNVTPVYDEGRTNADTPTVPEADQHSQQIVSYQASSPDEVNN